MMISPNSIVETPDGKTIEVFVNKRNPSNSVISRDIDWDFLIQDGLGACLR